MPKEVHPLPKTEKVWHFATLTVVHTQLLALGFGTFQSRAPILSRAGQGKGVKPRRAAAPRKGDLSLSWGLNSVENSAVP